MKPLPRASEADSAFALIDLLAVVLTATIVCLLVFPVMGDSRASNRTLQCRNNLQQLGLGWLMYADDYQGRLVPNRDGGSATSWVGGFLDYSSSPVNTNTMYLVGPSSNYGLLGPYLRSASVFRCPSDPSVVAIAGQRLPRVRSYSMNNCVGEGAQLLEYVSRSQTYSNLQSIVQPAPRQLWVVLEEHPVSINDGTFYTNPDNSTPVIIDYPAAYHNSCCNLLFADGHADSQRWLDGRTILQIRPGFPLPLNQASLGNADILWLQGHASGRK